MEQGRGRDRIESVWTAVRTEAATEGIIMTTHSMPKLRPVLTSIAACALLGAVPAPALAQCSPGGGTTGRVGFSLFTPVCPQSLARSGSWSFTMTIGFGQGGERPNSYELDPRHREVVEGTEDELVTLEGEPVETEGIGEPTSVGLARDLLADRWRPDDGVVEAVDYTELRSRRGRVEAAVAAMESHLDTNPDDLIAQRETALALVELRRVDEAVAMMADAYEQDPELGVIPISSEALGEGPRRLRDAVVRAVGHAQRQRTGEAWLLVAVLMQAEERFDVAARMLERAKDHGLSAEISTPMASAL